ncbi:MAG: H-NS histone family protein [Rhodobacteraceae bacterium]|nr:H-NS histone family protein [Paracoccaceae bacterium]
MAFNLNKMSIAELKKLISDAQMALAKKQEVADKVRKLAKDNGLNISDLVASEKTKAKKPRRKVAPKYKNPENGSETWTGRGRQPRWVASALEGGKTLDELLI